MKTQYFLIVLATMSLLSCASPEDRSNKQIDTNTIMVEDTAGTDTTVNGRSGDNGTGTDTTNTFEEKTIRESGKK